MSQSLSRTQRLIKYGFMNSDAQSKYRYDEKKKYWVPLNGIYDENDASEEFHEEAAVLPKTMGPGGYYTKTGYPTPLKKYRLWYSSASASIEETYYWLIEYLKIDVGFAHYKKLMDSFAASEQSAFWGQAQSRLSLQQDRAAQYMATIGKMVKDLFQLVRELRIIEERLDIYKKAPHSKSADVTLKGLYIDLVEGGSKNPGSVYGVAQQVGFTIIPDLFFNTMVYDEAAVDNKVTSMKWNEQVKNVLRRKLYSYINWVQKTESEMKSRFEFTLRYLRQHWNVIKMYMAWVKPYLRNVQRMRMSQEQVDSYEVISAFETSITEIETISYREPVKGVYPCILISMRYTTQPEMSFHQEGYAHKGPLHVGKVVFELRAYGWTQDDIDNFQRMRDDEDMELIKVIDESVAAAMDALGDELHDYLEKAGELLDKFDISRKIVDKKEVKRALGGVFDPVTSIFKGFGELLTSFGSVGAFKSGKKPKPVDKMKVAGITMGAMWLCYKKYKQAHRMLAW